MSKYLLIIKNHYISLICALFFSVIIVSPHLVFLLKTGDSFRGVYQTFSDDEIYYQARIAEVMRGNYWVGNPYIKEHMDDLFLQPPLAEWLFAGLAFVTGLSIPVATLLGDIIFSFILFILFCRLFYLLTEDSILSTIFTSLLFFLFISTFGRPISPQISSIFLSLGLLLISAFYLDKDFLPRYSFLPHHLFGLIVGLLLFISPYYWTALIVLYLFLAVNKFFLGTDKNIQFKKILCFLTSFAPFLIFYGYFLIRSSQFPGYFETMERFGLIQSHWPGSFTNVGFGILTLIFLFLFKKEIATKTKWFSYSLVLSTIVLNWQNIITGKSLQFSSHYLFVTILFILMAIALLAVSVFRSDTSSKKSRIVFIIGSITLVVMMICVQWGEIRGLVRSVLYQRPINDLQAKSDVFNFLNQNTEKNSVIYTLGGGYDFLLPVYTHNKPYYNFYATLSVMPNSETEERWLIQNLFNPKLLDGGYVREKQRDFWGNRFIDLYQSRENRKKMTSLITKGTYTPSVQIDPDLISQLEDRFRILKKMDLHNALNKYDIDYILLSGDYAYHEYAKDMLNGIKSANYMMTINGNRIYKFVK